MFLNYYVALFNFFNYVCGYLTITKQRLLLDLANFDTFKNIIIFVKIAFMVWLNFGIYVITNSSYFCPLFSLGFDDFD